MTEFQKDIYQASKKAVDAAEADILASPALDSAGRRRIMVQRVAEAITAERLRCYDAVEFQHKLAEDAGEHSEKVGCSLTMKKIAGGRVR